MIIRIGIKAFIIYSILLVFILASIEFCKPKKLDYYKIGVILDLTGPIAPYGQWSKNGLLMALDEINVPKKKIELIIEDGRSTAQAAVSAFNKLINIDKVKVVLITTGSSSVLSIAPIANEREIILFTPAASSPDITTAGDFVFRNRLSGLQEVEQMAMLSHKDLDFIKGALLVVNNDFGQSYGKVFKETFEEMGGDIAVIDHYEQGTSDMRTQLTKIMSIKNLDFVYLVGYASECGHILRQAKELRLGIQWLSTIGIESDEVIKIAGDAADGVIYSAPRYLYNDPNVTHFEKKYFDQFQEHSNLYAANSYDALMILYSIIEDVGYDSMKIKNALYEIKNYPGVSGITSFDDNGDVIKPVMLKIIKNGNFEIYNPNEK